MTEKKGLFYQNWTKGEDEYSEEEMQLAADDLKMKFERDFDKMRERIIANKRNVSSMLKNKLKSFNLNEYRTAAQEVMDCERAKTEIAKIYEEFFGEVIKR